MTLGKKLSSYRKIAGLTQQQLGEHLNLSAQAISKWENDLAEPDLSALRALAELYKVSVDELLDPNATSIDIAGSEQEEDAGATEGAAQMPIGYCKECGVAVTEENLGTREPVITCKRCAAAREEAAKRAALQKKRQEEQKKALEKSKKEGYCKGLKKERTVAFVLAGLATAVFVAIMIAAMVSEFSVGLLLFTLIGGYMVFAMVTCLRYDCWVEEVLLNWTTKAFEAPGLIITFDLEGCLWAIGMKILFFVVGALFGLVCGAIGLLISLLIAPFVFPYVMYHVHRSIKTGEPCEVSYHTN